MRMETLPPRGSPRLLIVEDDASFGTIMAAYLDAAGYETARIMQGRQVFGRLDRGRYDTVLLDTLDDMEAARALYEELGFEDIPPYYHNPIAGAHYLKADLWNTSPAPLSSRG